MTFVAATWNVFHGTQVNELRPILKALLDRDQVTLILAQEASDRNVRQMFEDQGLEIAYHPPQYVIARVPAVWAAKTPGRGVVLSQTGFLSARGTLRHSEAVVQQLIHRETGRVLRAMSYHTPAHVQIREPAPARVRAAIESAQKWRRMADRAETNAILFGGDDNVDEDGAFMDRLKWFRDRYTGLRQVQSPDPTHGRRRIDDFRIRGLIPLEGKTRFGGGDHKIHVRKFGWKGER